MFLSPFLSSSLLPSLPPSRCLVEHSHMGNAPIDVVLREFQKLFRMPVSNCDMHIMPNLNAIVNYLWLHFMLKKYELESRISTLLYLCTNLNETMAPLHVATLTSKYLCTKNNKNHGSTSCGHTNSST